MLAAVVAGVEIFTYRDAAGNVELTTRNPAVNFSTAGDER